MAAWWWEGVPEASVCITLYTQLLHMGNGESAFSFLSFFFSGGREFFFLPERGSSQREDRGISESVWELISLLLPSRQYFSSTPRGPEGHG